jgi:hypothetical protein
VNGRGWDDVEFFAGTMTTKEEKILKTICDILKIAVLKYSLPF